MLKQSGVQLSDEARQTDRQPRLAFAWLSALLGLMAAASVAAAAEPIPWPAALPGTELLTIAAPLDEVMVAGIDRYALRAIEQAAHTRRQRPLRLADSDSDAARLHQLRERLATRLGIVDPRSPLVFESLARTSLTVDISPSTRLSERSDERYTIQPIRWTVLDGVTGEGLLLLPTDAGLAGQPVRGSVIAIPDAGWTPERFCGVDRAHPEASPLPRRLVEAGFRVLIPTLISRDTTHAGNPTIAMTNQSHREWVYRPAFEVGRHPLGLEVQKIRAALEGLATLDAERPQPRPIAVAGVGEGARLALLAAALDDRIAGAFISGGFEPREHLWEEPIDRNVWGLLLEHGDAELAAMVAPRSLVIEAAAIPTVTTPADVPAGRRQGAAPGVLKTPALAAVEQEFSRVPEAFALRSAGDRVQLIRSGTDGTGPAGSEAALAAFVTLLDGGSLRPTGTPLTVERVIDADARQGRQVRELVDLTQRLMRSSHKVRDAIWQPGKVRTVDNWESEAKARRAQLWTDFIGRLPAEPVPPRPRSRRMLETDAYVGYEIVLDVLPDVIASGILLVPRSLPAKERRPVVVCQHGLEGVPMDTISGPGTAGYPYYKAFAATLAEQGFVVYAPQNPYRGGDRFRTLQRKSNPLARSLFSYILEQHRVTLDWLAAQPWVDAQRIAFYGLSYGGKTAVRVPPLLDRYCLSICSADFNEWVFKNTTVDERPSYVFTGEYEIFEWNMAHVANYAELSMLMAPRPFMVERGHDDGVGLDEWVAWEYAKVRRFYNKLGIGDRTTIEFFNGPHTIHGVGTFGFLRKHLEWPPPQ